MHDGIVHRGANGAGEAAVALEGGNAALGADDLLGDGVQLGGGDTGLDRLAHTPQRQRRHAARLLHGLDLSRRLQLHCHGITLSRCYRFSFRATFRTAPEINDASGQLPRTAGPNVTARAARPPTTT